MANEKNLIPVRSGSEAREKGAKGGKASGEARRKRKALKEYMEILLECKPDGRAVGKLKRMGIAEDDMNAALAINMAMVKEAMAGNVAAFKEIRDLIGEAGEKTDLNALDKAKEILGGVESAF